LDRFEDQGWGSPAPRGLWAGRASDRRWSSPIGELRNVTLALLFGRNFAPMDVALRMIPETKIGWLRDPDNSPLTKRAVHKVRADGHASFRPGLADLQHDAQRFGAGFLQLDGQARFVRVPRLGRQIDFLNALLGFQRFLYFHLGLRGKLKLPA